MRAICARCGSSLRQRGNIARSNSRTAAIALAALILYPIAITLPMLKIQQFGHHNETSILQGIITLLSKGQLLVGMVVLVCSIIFPLGKLFALLALTSNRVAMANHHKVFTWRLIEWTGRWGMLDVLLVAILVAALKLGNMMEVTPGPAALAFSACVMLSLLASASFNPHSVWETQR